MATIPSVRRIPIVGSQIYKVGQVADIVTQACSPDPEIYILAAFANVPMLLWSLVKPDPVDYVADRFGQHHHRRRRNRFSIGDINIGDPGQGNGHLRWASFRGTQILQKVGWYFVVIDATTDFLVNWHSMAYRYSGCQDPTSGYAQSTDDNGFEFLSGGADFGCSGGSPSFTPGFAAFTGSVGTLLPGAHSIAANISFVDRPGSVMGTVTGVELRSSNPNTGNTPIDISALGPGGNQGGSFLRNGYNVLEPAQSYTLWIKSTPGWIRVQRWSLSLTGWPQNPGYAPDP